MNEISGFTPVLYSQTSLTDTAASSKATQQQSRQSTFDHAEISKEGLARLEEQTWRKAMEQAEASSGAEGGETNQSLWTSRYGLESGTFFKADGSKEIVSVKDNEIEILKYQGDRLVSKTTGFADSTSATTNTEYYDEEGKLIQTASVIVSGIDDTSSKESRASLQRSMQWFKDGEVVREMRDWNVVQANYKPVDPEHMSADTLEGMIGATTRDKLSSSYGASFREYSNGKLIRSAEISHSLTAEGVLNRSRDKDVEFDRAKPVFSTVINDYDEEGNLVREAAFSEKIGTKPKGMFKPSVALLEQNSRVSWYTDGKLVKRTEGELEVEESRASNLPSRADMLGVLGLSQEDYVKPKPQSAGELLSAKFAKAIGQSTDASDPGWEEDYVNAGDPDTLRNTRSPYSISVSNEVYSEGRLVARQVDEERSEENTLPLESRFRTGRGLTEGSIPELLHSSRHVDESFENGIVSTRGEIDMHETLKQDDRGLYTVETVQNATLLKSGNTERDFRTMGRELKDVDPEFGKASEMWEREADLTVDDIMGMLG
ncbi:hypothetical protein [Salidesulfovibrio onnuriiensis]|uniref:hypothetical protein n=1 Tax=Salidesulfovibrio onnuriiensis TaxID=2583823 RepID=UPI0011C8D17A|nr:hypothetical protein [Salidesulfovibrio onnuriiensis]